MKEVKIGELKFKSNSKAIEYMLTKHTRTSRMKIAKKLNVAPAHVTIVAKKMGLESRKYTKKVLD